MAGQALIACRIIRWGVGNSLDHSIHLLCIRAFRCVSLTKSPPTFGWWSPLGSMSKPPSVAVHESMGAWDPCGGDSCFNPSMTFWSPGPEWPESRLESAMTSCEAWLFSCQVFTAAAPVTNCGPAHPPFAHLRRCALGNRRCMMLIGWNECLLRLLYAEPLCRHTTPSSDRCFS